MLKIQHSAASVNPTAYLICCFDVSKGSLSLFAEYRTGVSTCRVEDEIPNRTRAIEAVLGRLAGLAGETGLEGLTLSYDEDEQTLAEGVDVAQGFKLTRFDYAYTTNDHPERQSIRSPLCPR